MARTRLIDYLSDPEKLDEQSLDALKEALETYPFFQAGRMLWIKNLHKLENIRYNSELKLAAAFIPDRSKLFFLINNLFSPNSPHEESITKQPANNKNNPNSDIAQSSAYEKHTNHPKKGTLTQPENEDQAPDKKKSKDQAQNTKDHEQTTGDDANYFSVDDSIVSSTGETIDFSLSHNNENQEITKEVDDITPEDTTKTKNQSSVKNENLLDYEKETYAQAYSIEKVIETKPLDFNETHPFSEWLNLLKNNSVNSGKKEEPAKETPSTPTSPEKGNDLIENFLNNAGNQKRIVPTSEHEESKKDFSAKSVEENDDLMTETLANIHIKQERYQKAIDIFERLRLKYPEKSVYFARRIKEMEELINNQ